MNRHAKNVSPRAMAMRCFCPPEMRWPWLPSFVL